MGYLGSWLPMFLSFLYGNIFKCLLCLWYFIVCYHYCMIVLSVVYNCRWSNKVTLLSAYLKQLMLFAEAFLPNILSNRLVWRYTIPGVKERPPFNFERSFILSFWYFFSKTHLKNKKKLKGKFHKQRASRPRTEDGSLV